MDCTEVVAFTANNREEVDVILTMAQSSLDPEPFNVVKRVYDNDYVKNPARKTFPMYKWAYLPFMIEVLKGSD